MLYLIVNGLVLRNSHNGVFLLTVLDMLAVACVLKPTMCGNFIGMCSIAFAIKPVQMGLSSSDSFLMVVTRSKHMVGIKFLPATNLGIYI